MRQESKRRLHPQELKRRLKLTIAEKQAEFTKTREGKRRSNSWKRNGILNGKPLTRSAIRRIGSRDRAIKLGVVKV